MKIYVISGGTRFFYIFVRDETFSTKQRKKQEKSDFGDNFQRFINQALA
jgi:hypothetical protein